MRGVGWFGGVGRLFLPVVRARVGGWGFFICGLLFVCGFRGVFSGAVVVVRVGWGVAGAGVVWVFGPSCVGFYLGWVFLGASGCSCVWGLWWFVVGVCGLVVGWCWVFVFGVVGVFLLGLCGCGFFFLLICRCFGGVCFCLFLAGCV